MRKAVGIGYLISVFCTLGSEGSAIGADEVDCWYKCGKTSGLCQQFCGPSGFCCRKGWAEKGCDGTLDGGDTMHICTTKDINWHVTGNNKCKLVAIDGNDLTLKQLGFVSGSWETCRAINNKVQVPKGSAYEMSVEMTITLDNVHKNAQGGFIVNYNTENLTPGHEYMTYEYFFIDALFNLKYGQMKEGKLLSSANRECFKAKQANAKIAKEAKADFPTKMSKGTTITLKLQVSKAKKVKIFVTQDGITKQFGGEFITCFSTLGHGGVGLSMKAYKSKVEFKNFRMTELGGENPVVNCEWNPWSKWTSCSKTCGGQGTMTRTRDFKIEAANGGNDCEGNAKDTQECGLDPCPTPVDCEWNAWSEFTLMRRRNFKIEAANGGNACEGNVIETHPIPVDCKWNPWSIWTPCSKTCGHGTMTRTRNIKTEESNGGEVCDGEAKETLECRKQPCPIDCEWNPWSKWTPCSKTCGGQGTMTRSRDFKIAAANGGETCEGNAKETQQCGKQPPCPIDCEWTAWSIWTPCSKSCGGGGDTTRTREVKIEAANGGKACDGIFEEIEECGMEPCPIDCQWNQWSEWTPCSISCGGGQGTQTSTRDVKIAAAHGGNDCEGDTKQTQNCAVREPCPSNCQDDEAAKAECQKIAAENNNLDEMESGSYSTKGCYYYTKGHSAGKAWFGTGGTGSSEWNSLLPLDGTPSRILIGCSGSNLNKSKCTSTYSAYESCMSAVNRRDVPNSMSYKTKGCYTYKTGKYKGNYYFGNQYRTVYPNGVTRVDDPKRWDKSLSGDKRRIVVTC